MESVLRRPPGPCRGARRPPWRRSPARQRPRPLAACAHRDERAPARPAVGALGSRCWPRRSPGAPGGRGGRALRRPTGGQGPRSTRPFNALVRSLRIGPGGTGRPRPPSVRAWVVPADLPARKALLGALRQAFSGALLVSPQGRDPALTPPAPPRPGRQRHSAGLGLGALETPATVVPLRTSGTIIPDVRDKGAKVKSQGRHHPPGKRPATMTTITISEARPTAVPDLDPPHGRRLA